ncbi:MAG: hypothetical protein IAI48_00425 [Candidatus Eremiobacteraeota bacterium]|nr:hypothetical protein [Candidatus Eremiobacteraeota bacterium]
MAESYVRCVQGHITAIPAGSTPPETCPAEGCGARVERRAREKRRVRD